MKWLTELWRYVSGRRPDFYEVELHGPGWFRLTSGSIFRLEHGKIILRYGRGCRMIWGPFETRKAAREFKKTPVVVGMPRAGR